MKAEAMDGKEEQNSAVMLHSGQREVPDYYSLLQ
jgi:hypothetical protein